MRIGWGRAIAVGLPYLWLLAFFFAPFLVVLKISFSEPVIAQPPYAPTWDDLEAVPAPPDARPRRHRGRADAGQHLLRRPRLGL